MFTAIVWAAVSIISALVIIGLILPHVFANRCDHMWQVTSNDERSFTKQCARCNKTKMEKRA